MSICAKLNEHNLGSLRFVTHFTSLPPMLCITHGYVSPAEKTKQKTAKSDSAGLLF